MHFVLIMLVDHKNCMNDTRNYSQKTEEDIKYTCSKSPVNQCCKRRKD